MVSGVTIPATSSRSFRPRAFPLTASRRRSSFVVRQTRSSPTELTLEDAVLLDQVIDDSLLVAVDPAGYGNDQNFPRVYRSAHNGGF